jgi:hypothetical protein
MMDLALTAKPGPMSFTNMTILAHLGYGGPKVRTWAMVDLLYVADGYMMH